MIDKDEDGDHAPLLLDTLDLSHWTSLLYVSTFESVVEKAMTCLWEAHEVLPNFLEKDKIDLAKALANTQVVETALWATNPLED